MLHVYPLHIKYRKETVQRQNKVFYDPRIILLVSKDSGNKFYVLYRPPPKCSVSLYDIFLSQQAVYEYTRSEKEKIINVNVVINDI